MEPVPANPDLRPPINNDMMDPQEKKEISANGYSFMLWSLLQQ